MGFYDFNARTIFNLQPYTFFFLSDNHFFFGIHRHSEMAQCGALRQMLDSDAGPSGPDGEL
jgi:hypothetical protein